MLAGAAPLAFGGVAPAPQLSGPITISIPEDGAEHDFTFTLSNAAGGVPLFISGFSVTPGTPTGDVTDIAKYSWGAGGSAPCGTEILQAATCTMNLGLTPDSGSGEQDGDSGTQLLQLFVNFFLPTFPDIIDSGPLAIPGFSATTTTTVTVNDLAPTGVPEPATLSLLGIGFAGAALARSRKGKKRSV